MPTSSAMIMLPVPGGEKSKKDKSLKVYGTYYLHNNAYQTEALFTQVWF
jgi:hypothetical protein